MDDETLSKGTPARTIAKAPTSSMQKQPINQPNQATNYNNVHRVFLLSLHTSWKLKDLLKAFSAEEFLHEREVLLT